MPGWASSTAGLWPPLPRTRGSHAALRPRRALCSRRSRECWSGLTGRCRRARSMQPQKGSRPRGSSGRPSRLRLRRARQGHGHASSACATACTSPPDESASRKAKALQSAVDARLLRTAAIALACRARRALSCTRARNSRDRSRTRWTTAASPRDPRCRRVSHWACPFDRRLSEPRSLSERRGTIPDSFGSAAGATASRSHPERPLRLSPLDSGAASLHDRVRWCAISRPAS